MKFKLFNLLMVFILLCPLIFIFVNIFYLETIVEKYNPGFEYEKYHYEMNFGFSVMDKFTHPINVLTMLNYHLNEVDGKLKISLSLLLIDLYQLVYTLIGVLALITTGLLFGLLISNDEKVQVCCASALPLLAIGVILISMGIELMSEIYII